LAILAHHSALNEQYTASSLLYLWKTIIIIIIISVCYSHEYNTNKPHVNTILITVRVITVREIRDRWLEVMIGNSWSYK